MTERARGAEQARLVDCHCHVDLYEDPQRVVKDCERLEIYTIAVTNAPSLFEHTAALTRGCKFVRPAVGMHPELVVSHGGEVDRMWPHLEQTRYVGEIGLDYTSGERTVRERQRAVFSSILERCAALRGKVLTIHSRRAAGEVTAAIGESFPGTIILHWFSGTAKEAEKAADFGFFFSVNLAMTRSESGKRFLRAVPRDRVLIESDGPFVRVANKAACPSHSLDTVFAIAKIWGADPEATRTLIYCNFRRCLG